MKQLEQNGFGLVLPIAIVILTLVAGLTVWQITKNRSIKPQTAVVTPAANNDCGSNTACFYEAYNSGCSQKSVKTTRNTVEGNPIITTAKLSRNEQSCVVAVTVDGSQDKFGDGKVHSYTCKKIAQAENQILTASECTGSTEATSVTI